MKFDNIPPADTPNPPKGGVGLPPALMITKKVAHTIVAGETSQIFFDSIDLGAAFSDGKYSAFGSLNQSLSNFLGSIYLFEALSIQGQIVNVSGNSLNGTIGDVVVFSVFAVHD